MSGDVIREVDRAGRLVREWKASEHLDPAALPVHPGFGRHHWPLVDGLDVTAEGLVLTSLRTTSGVIGVEKATGAVALHIPPAVVSHQHAPVALPNGRILVFDNGNFRRGSHVAFSRVLEIEPAAGTLHSPGRLTAFWKLRLPAALPNIIAGLRISAGVSVIGAIAGESAVRG